MRKIILVVLCTFCYFGCKHKPDVKISEVKLVSIEQEKEEQPLPPPPPQAIAASAYLVYDDGSLSEFDVLHDKTKALWNTIIGAGDAEKPSKKVKLIFHGAYDSISVKVKNGKRLALDKKNLSFNGKLNSLFKIRAAMKCLLMLQKITLIS